MSPLHLFHTEDREVERMLGNICGLESSGFPVFFFVSTYKKRAHAYASFTLTSSQRADSSCFLNSFCSGNTWEKSLRLQGKLWLTKVTLLQLLWWMSFRRVKTHLEGKRCRKLWSGDCDANPKAKCASLMCSHTCRHCWKIPKITHASCLSDKIATN